MNAQLWIEIPVFVVIISLAIQQSRHTSRLASLDSHLYMLEAKIDAILSHLGISFEYQATDRARALAKQGYPVEAIKVLRDANPDMGLKEAKEMTDTLKKSL